jgi:hypothetical protein
MRLVLLVLVTAILASTGCAAMVNASGTDLDLIRTREDVRKSLGDPDARGVIDGEEYEDFHRHRKIAERDKNLGVIMAFALTAGLSEFLNLPEAMYSATRQLIEGRDFRVVYGADGNVQTVYLDGRRHHGFGSFALPNKNDPLSPDTTGHVSRSAASSENLKDQ